MHPRASDFIKQAQAGAEPPDGLVTLINLTGMLEGSVQAAKTGQNPQAALDDLHEQFYALGKAFCGVTEAQAKTPAYAKASTIRRETRVVFHRLWKTREDAALRDVHLDLFGKRVQELRDALQAVKS